MIRRPVQLASAAHPPLADDAAREHARRVASAAGIDLGLAAANVARAGGDAEVFRTAMAAGMRGVSPEPTVEDEIVSLAAIAGWRAGALGLRSDALSRLGTFYGRYAGDVDVAAALGFGSMRDDREALAQFVLRQLADRLWWGGRHRANGYVAAVGGFSGYGGPWIAPPDAWRRLSEPGAFGIRTAGEWWRLDLDVWGARLRLDESAEHAAGGSTGDGTTVVVRPDTHLAWLHVRDAS